MRLVRSDLRRGKSPENDRFMVITEHDDADFIHSQEYLGIKYTRDFVMLQLTVSNTRTTEQKKQLYTRIAALLGGNPGIKPQDIFINLVEVDIANWSFGNGIAQYAETQ